MEKPQMRHMARPRHPLTRLRVQKGGNLRPKALRWLGGFLLLMLLFTLLSRAADELTIPRVSLGEPERRSIDREIRAFGKVEELSAQAVATLPGVRVAGISVKPGGRVELGEPLFTLDRADLEEKLREAQEQLEKMDLDLRDQSGREALDAQDRATALSRANQDYASAQASAGKEVDRAAKALEEAKGALAAYTPPPRKDLSPLEKALEEKASALKLDQDALLLLNQEWSKAAEEARKSAEEAGQDPDAAEKALLLQYQPKLDAAKEQAEAAQKEWEAAKLALEEARAAPEPEDNLPTLKAAVESAQLAYDQAVENRDSALRAAGRAIEDAQRPAAPDSSGEKARMDREAQESQVKKIAALLEGGCVVRAPKAGTVTALSVETGAPTPDGTAVLLAGEGDGAVFTAQVDASQEKFLAPGDSVLLKPGGDSRPELTGLTVESVAKNPQDSSLLDVTVGLPENALGIGDTAEMRCQRESGEYPACVPLSALHEENGGYFLLIPRQVETILGTELTAARLDVTVLEKNESYAALDEWSLSSGQKFLTYSNKTVRAGDRIRPETP